MAHESSFWGISGSFWGYFEHIDVEFHVRCMCHHFKLTLSIAMSSCMCDACLWGHFGCMRVGFQKTFIFPIDSNDFIKHWGSFGVILGPLLAYESNFWGISGSL